MQITARELSLLLQGEVEGNPDVKVNNLAKIEEAQPHELSFIANPKYEAYASTTAAGILVVSKDFKTSQPLTATLIRVDDPYRSFTHLLEMYKAQQEHQTGIEQPSFIAPNVTMGGGVYVGAFSYISEHAVIGDNVKIYPNCHIGSGVHIGDNTVLYPGVKLYMECKVGKNCIIHSGAIIGSDGFGFAPNQNGSFVKIPQTGNVVLEDDVEVGANTTIDRATMGSTIIRKGVKIDNLVQIAHNVEVGENTVIAAQTGISGSTKIGRNCMIGGQVGIVGHIKIADGTKIQAQSGVAKSIEKENTAWAGAPAFDYTQNLKSNIIFRNLPELDKRIRELERLISQR